MNLEDVVDFNVLPGARGLSNTVTEKNLQLLGEVLMTECHQFLQFCKVLNKKAAGP